MLTIRGSEYQDFLNCRKKWYYSWIEEIEPKRPDGKLFTGTIGHKFLEHLYNGENAHILTSKFIDEQETGNMESFEIDDIRNLTNGMCNHYMDYYKNDCDNWKTLFTEMEFRIKLNDWLEYTGTIDLVILEDEKLIFADHKFVSSLDQYEDKAKMDRQISRYWWVLNELGKGNGEIKDKETGEWRAAHELFGYEVDHFIYNLIKKKLPIVPELLKKGGLSQAKNQDTTYDIYLQAIIDNSLNEEDYSDFLSFLKSKPNNFFRRIPVYRNETELNASMRDLIHVSKEVEHIKDWVLYDEYINENAVEHLTYRNINDQCSHMCQYKAICQAEIEGYDQTLIRNELYRKKEKRQ